MTTIKRLMAIPGTLVLLLLLFSVFALPALAQPGGIITGTITDADTKESLPASTVQIQTIRLGAKSDITGKYRITKVPAGTYKIEAKLIGYQTVTKDVTLAENETVTVNFALSVRALQQDEIIVTGLTGEIDRKKLGNVIGKVDGTDVARVV